MKNHDLNQLESVPIGTVYYRVVGCSSTTMSMRKAFCSPQVTMVHQDDAHQSCNYQELRSIMLNSADEASWYRFQLVDQLTLSCSIDHRVDLQSSTTEKLTKVRRR
jgi:hypothetical protein